MFRAQIQVPAAAIFAALSNLRLAFSVNGPCKENTAAVDRNNASRNPLYAAEGAAREGSIPGMRSRYRPGAARKTAAVRWNVASDVVLALDRHLAGRGIVRRSLL